MRLTVLGSGDASGLPRPDCTDAACICVQARNGQVAPRGNACALVSAGGTTVAIDTGAGPQTCDALLLTHYHSDHAGNAPAFAPIRAFGPNDGATATRSEKHRRECDRFPAPRAAGLDLTMVAPFTVVQIGALGCTALPLNHPVPVHGWAVESAGRRIAWLTDTYGIPAATLAWLADHPCDLLALDTTFAPGVERAPLKGHGDLAVSLAAIRASGARRGLLIHVGHGLHTWLDTHPDALPATVEPAHDGQILDL